MTNPIGWCDVTWNPITGCDSVSPGCDHCWARRMARRLAGRHGYPEAPNHFDVTLHPDTLEQPLKWKKPRRVFVCSMSDLFHPGVDHDFRLRIFETIAATPQHTYMILTKRPESCKWGLPRLFYLWKPLSNVWLGVTAENQEQADKRIPLLLQTPAAVRFVSVEPCLSAVDIRAYLWAVGASTVGPWRFPSGRVVHTGGMGGQTVSSSPANELHWCICGAETGPGARPMELVWARDLRDQCKAAGVPFFMKAVTGGMIPDDLMIREFPE